MDELQQHFEQETRHGEVPPHHIRSKTLRSMRKRLAILREESAKLNVAPDEDLDESTAAHLTMLRSSLRKCQNDDTLLAMRSLIKKLETELAAQGFAPEEHIQWVFEQLQNE